MARTSLPPGFRFHPTDVELVKYYLKRKLMGKRFLFDAVSELNIYKYSPWDLPDKSCLRSKDLEWYFFCPNERKYASGARTNRATESGFWKSTGKDRPVIYNEQAVGMVKTLVFHRGHAPKGERTDWVMYEYRIQDKELADAGIVQDAYVLCKVFQKSGRGPKAHAHYGAPFNEEDWEEDDDDDDDDTEFCGLSLQSNSLPSPALLYDKNSSVGNTCRGPSSMPGPSNILPSADEVPSLPKPCPSPILPHAVEVPPPLLEIDDFISLSDILKEDGSLLLDHNVRNEVEENFSQEKNAEAFTGLDGNEIFGNLEDLGNWPDLGGGGFKVSSNQTTEYGVIPVLGGGHEEFLELNDLNATLNFPSGSTISTDFLSANSCKPYYNNHWDQDYFLVDSFGAVQNVSSMNQLPLLPEGSNGHDNRSLACQENGNRGSANLGFTVTSCVENRGTQERKPYSRLQQLLESIPAHHASAAELFAPANEAERSDKTNVFSIYGGSSIHFKAEVTRRGGACTKDALLGESPYSFCGCNLSMMGSGKKVVKFGSGVQSFFFLAIISTIFWVVLVEIVITTLGRHAWNFVSS